VELIEAVRNENTDLIVVAINVTGNWMVPQVQAGAVDKTAQTLSEIYPENAAHYQTRAETRTQAILAKGEEVKSRLQQAGVAGVNVLCAEMQVGFVRWAGFNITANFTRPEHLTPARVQELIDIGNRTGVALVIDNLQSGDIRLGPSICESINAIPVTISNFPGGLENTETWEKAIYRNVDLLLAALNEWRGRYGG
jgi:ABC-type Zn uptake system ZnuABC Zn-binding protein ZnuA